MLACKNFKTYKAEKPPRCFNGKGCEACKQKWESINRAKARKVRKN